MAINWARRACCGLTATPPAWHSSQPLSSPHLHLAGAAALRIHVHSSFSIAGKGGWRLRSGQGKAQRDARPERGRWQGLQPKNWASTSPRRLLLSPREILTQASAKGLSTLVACQHLETNFIPKFFVQTRLHFRIFASFPDFSAFLPGQSLPPGFWLKARSVHS